MTQSRWATRVPFVALLLAAVCALGTVSGAASAASHHKKKPAAHHKTAAVSASNGCSYLSAAAVSKITGFKVTATSAPNPVSTPPAPGCNYNGHLPAGPSTIITTILTSKVLARVHLSAADYLADAVKDIKGATTIPGLGNKAVDFPPNGNIMVVSGSAVITILGPGLDPADRKVAADLAATIHS